jgi:PST family polysaccharide transporter
VGRLLGTPALGQLRYALRLAGAPFALLLAGAAYVLFPAFSRIAEDAARLQAAFLRSLRWICVLAFPAGMVFLPLGVPMAVVIFGDVWRDAGEALAALCLFPAGGMLASVVSEALKAQGEPRYLTRMHLVTALSTAGLIVVLQPFGLTAAAAAFSAGAMLGGVYSLVVMHRVAGTPARSLIAEVWPPAFAALIGAGALIPLEAVVDAESHGTVLGALLLAGEALVGGLIYLAVIRVVAPATAATIAEGARGLLNRMARFRGPDPATPEPEPLDETLAP